MSQADPLAGTQLYLSSRAVESDSQLGPHKSNYPKAEGPDKFFVLDCRVQLGKLFAESTASPVLALDKPSCDSNSSDRGAYGICDTNQPNGRVSLNALKQGCDHERAPLFFWSTWLSPFRQNLR
jgi:hypothetical protein